MMRTPIAILLLSASLLNASSFLAEETFSYTANSSISGANGGTGWSGAWVTTQGLPTAALVSSPGLSFPGMTTTGNKAVLGYDGFTYGLGRSLSSTINGTGYTSASLAFLFNLTGNDSETGIRFSGLSLFSGGPTGTELIYFGKPGNTNELGFQKYSGGGETFGVEESFDSGDVFLFEADFTLNTVGNSTVTVTLTSNAGSGTVLQTWSGVSLGTGFSFDSVRVIRDYALDSGIMAEFDEISITAIPEPGTVVTAAVLLCAATLLRRRRRN